MTFNRVFFRRISILLQIANSSTHLLIFSYFPRKLGFRVKDLYRFQWTVIGGNLCVATLLLHEHRCTFTNIFLGEALANQVPLAPLSKRSPASMRCDVRPEKRHRRERACSCLHTGAETSPRRLNAVPVPVVDGVMGILDPPYAWTDIPQEVHLPLSHLQGQEIHLKPTGETRWGCAPATGTSQLLAGGAQEKREKKKKRKKE